MKLPEVIGVEGEAPALAIFKPDANRLNAKKKTAIRMCL